MLIFSQGFGGAALFVGFLLLWLARTWRAPSAQEAVAFFVILAFLTLLAVYDTLDLPLFTLMTSIGLAWRAQRARVRRERSGSTTGALVSHLRSAAPAVAATVFLGAVVGVGWALLQPVRYTATAEVLLQASPGALSEGALRDVTLPPASTIDTEANLVVSDASLSKALNTQNRLEVAVLRRGISITAPPNTDVLDITVQGESALDATRRANAVVRSYLETRRDYLAERRQDALRELGGALAALDPIDTSDSRAEREELLRAAMTEVASSVVTAGELIQAPQSEAGRRQFEVPLASGVAGGLVAGLLLHWCTAGQILRRKDQP